MCCLEIVSVIKIGPLILHSVLLKFTGHGMHANYCYAKHIDMSLLKGTFPAPGFQNQHHKMNKIYKRS